MSSGTVESSFAHNRCSIPPYIYIYVPAYMYLHTCTCIHVPESSSAHNRRSIPLIRVRVRVRVIGLCVLFINIPFLFFEASRTLNPKSLNPKP